jgi:hypothetical protein
MQQPGPYVVIMEDDLIHTDEHPECDDPTCYCHGEQSHVAIVLQYEDLTPTVDLGNQE